MDKSRLRKEVRQRIALLSQDEKKKRGMLFCNDIKRYLDVCGARVVALFCPLADEPLITGLADELAGRILVAVPRVEGDIMRFYVYDSSNMQIGSFGISEPVGDAPLEPEDIDLMIVPGVVFTADGSRMGRGKGFYDKYMSQPGFRAMKIGICYAEQVVGNLPLESHDVKMDCVIYH